MDLYGFSAVLLFKFKKRKHMEEKFYVNSYLIEEITEVYILQDELNCNKESEQFAGSKECYSSQRLFG